MGYTHYWYVRDLEVVRGVFPAVARDFRELLPHLPPLAGPGGEGAPEVGGDGIALNGVRPDDYESFILAPRAEAYTETGRGLFGFCKTGRRPYDLAVQAALVLLKWHAGDAVEVASDGVLVEWREACARVARGLGYPVDPFFVLGRALYRVRDARGREFAVEAANPEAIPGFLEELARAGVVRFAPPFEALGDVLAPEGRPHPEVPSLFV